MTLIKEAFQERVIVEKRDLDDKRTKLQHFLNLGPTSSDTAAPVSIHDRSLLVRQLEAMDRYADILQERIQGFGRNPETRNGEPVSEDEQVEAKARELYEADHAGSPGKRDGDATRSSQPWEERKDTPTQNRYRDKARETLAGTAAPEGKTADPVDANSAALGDDPAAPPKTGESKPPERDARTERKAPGAGKTVHERS